MVNIITWFKILLLLLLLERPASWCLFKTYHELQGSQINEVDWSTDDKYIVVGSNSYRVTVLSFLTSNVVWFANFNNIVNTVKFSKTGKWLGVGFVGNDTIILYHISNFTLYKSFRAGHGNTISVNQLDFSNDDERIVTCGDDGNIIRRDVDDLALHYKKSKITICGGLTA